MRLDSRLASYVFTFTLPAETGLVMFSEGNLDVKAILYDRPAIVAEKEDGIALDDSPGNFLLWGTYGPDTYHLRVRVPRGPWYDWFTVRVRTIADTTGRSDAAEVELDGSEIGLSSSADDSDYFKFTLAAETDVMRRTGRSAVDTLGELFDSDGNSLAENDDGFLLEEPRRFLIRRKLAAGDYYVKVSSTRTGLYSLQVSAVTDPGSTIADAALLGFDEIGAGRMDSAADADYFKIVLAEATYIFARAASNTVDIDGAVLDDMGEPVTTNLFEQAFEADGPMGFVLSDRLDAGTHYIKVTRSGGDSTGGYVIRMVKDEVMNRIMRVCTARTSPFSDPLSRCQWHLRNRVSSLGARERTSGWRPSGLAATWAPTSRSRSLTTGLTQTTRTWSTTWT